MNKTGPHEAGWVSTAIRTLVMAETVIFLLAAAFHLGMPNFTGVGFLSLPFNLPAGIVEGSIGLLFGVSALALFTHRPRARTSVRVAHLYALLGVFIGIFALSGVFASLKGVGGGSGVSNDQYYHMIMLTLMLVCLALWYTPDGKAPWIARMLIRLTGIVQIILGLVFWVSQADGLLPFHILVGSILVLSLWALAFFAAEAGVRPGWIALAALWGLFLPFLGLIQAGLLVGPQHWIIQGVHLAVGLAAIGLGEALVAWMAHPRAPVYQGWKQQA